MNCGTAQGPVGWEAGEKLTRSEVLCQRISGGHESPTRGANTSGGTENAPWRSCRTSRS